MEDIDEDSESYDEICDFLDGKSIGDRKKELRESLEDTASKILPFINILRGFANEVFEKHVRRKFI